MEINYIPNSTTPEEEIREVGKSKTLFSVVYTKLDKNLDDVVAEYTTYFRTINSARKFVEEVNSGKYGLRYIVSCLAAEFEDESHIEKGTWIRESLISDDVVLSENYG